MKGYQPVNTTAALIVKLNTYLSEQQAPFNTNVLEYWLRQTQECSEIKELVFKLFTIPASSVSSERDCSTAEYTLNKRRSRLLPEKINKILYLNRNLKFVSDE